MQIIIAIDYYWVLRYNLSSIEERYFMVYIEKITTVYTFIFEISVPGILNFVLGMLTGIVLLTLLITFIATNRSRKKQRKRLAKLPEMMEEKVILEMIEAKQNQLVETVRLTDNAYFRVAWDLSLELAEEIARFYYPKAKYPIYEISIDELLELNYYITKRIETMVNGKILKYFKNYKISTIIDILNKKKAIDNSKLMKLNRTLKISKMLSVGKTILNYANPVYWFRKLAIKPSTVLVTKEVCKFIIAIVGEETNNVYSKSLFRHDDSETESASQTFDEVLEIEEE
jgi:hypothetical protein